MSLISLEKACVEVSFLIKFQAQDLHLSKKETPTQVFSCEICEIFKNLFYFEEHLQMTAFVYADYQTRKSSLENSHPVSLRKIVREVSILESFVAKLD